MPLELIIRPEAEADLAEVFEWYEDREPGLGFECLDAMGKMFDSICDEPVQFEVVHKNYRRALVKRFPYAIFFREEGSAAVVYAVTHVARRTARWRRRLS